MKESEQRHIFDSWLKQYKALFFKVIRAYAFTAFERDDLFQEISVQVWNSIPRFRHESAAKIREIEGMLVQELLNASP